MSDSIVGQRPFRLIAVGWMTMMLMSTGCESPEEAREIASAKGAVRAVLNDPASAQFRNIKVNGAKGKPVTVCGEVNAKNRMGGYNGFERFAYVLKTRELRIDPGELGTAPFGSALEKSVEQMKFNLFHIEQCISAGLPSEEETRAEGEAAFKQLVERRRAELKAAREQNRGD